MMTMNFKFEIFFKFKNKIMENLILLIAQIIEDMGAL